MNDRTPFERQVADRIAEEPRSIPLPASLVSELTSQASHARQRPRWLALIKEPPMRSDSHLAVGSPTVRVVAIMVATLLLATAFAAIGVAGQRLLAADGRIIVDRTGNGDHDFTTISEAIAAAKDGDEFIAMPGRYVENLAIVGKDLTIRGHDDSDREDIVIEVDPNGPAPGYRA